MIEVKSDIFLFKNVISPDQKQELLDWKDRNYSKFYIPKLKSGKKMSIQMLCLGWHWDATDYKYYKSRTDVDGKEVDSYLPLLSDIAKPFSLASFPYHNPSWDIAICNIYQSTGKLGLHVDNSESPRSLAIGHPVISFSLGSACRFQVGGLNRSDPIKEIVLDDCDVLIFGGESRMIYHGVGKLLGPERINFTLRKM